jgi:hypothetical protein
VQLEEAEEAFERYLGLALRIYERIQADPDAYAQFKALTASESHPSMHATRSKLSDQTSTNSQS